MSTKKLIPTKSFSCTSPLRYKLYKETSLGPILRLFETICTRQSFGRFNFFCSILHIDRKIRRCLVTNLWTLRYRYDILLVYLLSELFFGFPHLDLWYVGNSNNSDPKELLCTLLNRVIWLIVMLYENSNLSLNKSTLSQTLNRCLLRYILYCPNSSLLGFRYIK